MNRWEIAANLFATASILLAGRNSIHTWWLGIIGCALFSKVYLDVQLYSAVILQGFFIITSASGWWAWVRGDRGQPIAVRYTPLRQIAAFAAAAGVVAAINGWLFHQFTNAAEPFADSAMLAFSVLGQFLLMDRRVESWWCWLLVNTIAVPLFASRELHLTAVLYGAYWVNAIVALRHWRNLAGVRA